MNALTREPLVPRYRTINLVPRWTMLVAPVPRLGHPGPASWSWRHQLLSLRTGVAVLIIVPYCTVAGMFSGAALLEQIFTVLVLALLVSIVQLQVESRFAAHTTAVLPDAPQAGPVGLLEPAEHEFASCKDFNDAVRRALTQLADPTKLARSPLLSLALVSAGLAEQGLADTCLHRVAILTEVLAGLVAELRPRQQHEQPTGDAWRFYNCLYYPYVARISRRRTPTVLRELRERREQAGGPCGEMEQVLAWLLQVDEDTYYKVQRRASDTLALSLRDRERAAGGIVPADSLRAAVA